jgi:hypothetical protein
MEVDFMDSDYQCFIDIGFDGGDIQFDVSDDIQSFSFKSGIGFVAIPHLLLTLSSLYKGEISEARLECHGNSDYYIFSRYGTNLLIEHNEHDLESTVFNYQFKLREYMDALDTGFQKYLQQLEKEGIFPLKTQEFGHPLGDDVLNAFHDFSLLLNR